MQTKKRFWFILGAVILVVVGFIFRDKIEGMLPANKAEESVVPQIDLQNQRIETGTQHVERVSLPSNTVAQVSGPQVIFNIWEWNSQMGLILANGGPLSTVGSFMEKNGVNLKLVREDDNDNMKRKFMTFVKEYYEGNAFPTGDVAHFFACMGDGSGPSFLGPLYEQIKNEYGEDYTPVVVGSCGRSDGEDQYMSIPEILQDKNKARGTLVACVELDGDQAVVLRWGKDNEIPANTDDRYFDMDATNFVNAKDYLKAAEMYIQGMTVTREVIKNGKKTGEKITLKVNGVATWTPGDVNIVKSIGGLVTIASTKKYSSQMPNVIVGCKKFAREHKRLVENILDATFKAGDQIKVYDDALLKAGDCSYRVYNDQDAEYWAKYYKGSEETDKFGNKVMCGGSRVFNLSDNLSLFGLDGSADKFKNTYEAFGQLMKKLYPKMDLTIPPYEEIIYLEPLKALMARTPVRPEAEKFKYGQGEMKSVSGKRNWQIQFETGSAEFTSQAHKDLEEMFSDLLISQSQRIIINGHTDNVGEEDQNEILSLRRAIAVRKYLEQKSRKDFEGRVNTQGFGETKPIADNATKEGQKKNRRVEVIIGE